MTPTRRGPRKQKSERIRYMVDEERSGGTTEQGIRMGPVSVLRATREHGGTTGRKRSDTAARPRIGSRGRRAHAPEAPNHPNPQPEVAL